MGFEDMYDNAIYDGLMNDTEFHEAHRVRELRQRMLKSIIDERRRFLVEHFPYAIRRAVELLYKTELTCVEKKQRDIVFETTTKLETRACSRHFCPGRMTSENGTWTCCLCHSAVCLDCESDIDPTRSHECHADDLASVQWKSALPRCPKCAQPIEKSVGCRYVTCAVCGSNFDYATGFLSSAGNHGQSTPVMIPSDGISRLMGFLLRGRGLEQLNDKETALYKELIELQSIGMVNVSTEWNAHSVLRTGTASAKTVSLRIQKLEERRQDARRVRSRLKQIENTILHESQSITSANTGTASS